MADMRASDADREQTAETLRHAAATGQLTVEELDQRLHEAYRGVTRNELARLTDDLSPAAAPSPPPAIEPAADQPETDRILSIMSGADRRGRWRVAPTTRVTNIMGGSSLDLNDAEFGAQEMHMRVFSFWGGADIRVPEGLTVHVRETNIMGGNDVRLGDIQPPPGAPVLHLRLISIMAGASVKRGRKTER